MKRKKPMFVKRVVGLAISIVFISLSIFTYAYLSKQELQAKQLYVSTQCIRKKNSTVFEVRGGNSVLFAMRNAAALTLFSNKEDNNASWLDFTRDLIVNTQFKIIGGAALQEMTATQVRNWALQRNIEPTERAPNGGRRPLRYDRNKYVLIVEDYPDTASLGFDYWSDPQRRALIEKGYRTKNIVLSDPSPSISGQIMTNIVVFYIPVLTGAYSGVSAGYDASKMVPELASNEDVVLQLSINNIMAYEDSRFKYTTVRSMEKFALADQPVTLQCGAVFEKSSVPVITLTLGIVGGLLLSALTTWVIHLMSSRLLDRLKSDEEVRIATMTAQAVKRDADAKSAFLASVSHELRTPINGLLWMANFLRETVLSEEQQELVDNLQISGKNLLQIVDDVLDFSKIEANQMKIDVAPFDLLAFLKEVSLLFRHQAESKNNLFILKNEISLAELWIVSDRNRIKQILNNIVSNALKFTDSGIVSLSCNYEADQLMFHVTDTGIGIDEKILPTLFQPYVQADTSTTRRFGGTGLGLVISRRLARLLDGDIECESTFGHGSTFHIHLRCAVAQPDDRNDVPVPEQLRFSGHVLVAEDNPINQKVTAKVLKNMGIDVTIVEDGQKVLDVIGTGVNFDLVLMDLSMPVMSGADCTVELRKRGYTLPIIGLTANTLSGERERCFSLGMTDFLTKPIVKDDMVNALKKVLHPIGTK